MDSTHGFSEAFKIINQPANVFIVSSDKLIDQIARQLAIGRMCDCRHRFYYPKPECNMFYDNLICNPYTFNPNIKREVFEDCVPILRREMVDLTQALESSNSLLSLRRTSSPKKPKYVGPTHGIHLFGLENSEIVARHKKENNISSYQARLELWNQLDKNERSDYSNKTIQRNSAKKINK